MKKIILLFMFLVSISGYAQFPETFDTEIPATWAIFSGANGLGTAQSWIQSNDDDDADDEGFAVINFEDVDGGLAEDWLVTPRFKPTENTKIFTFTLTDVNDDDFGSNMTVRISSNESQTSISSFFTLLTINETDISLPLVAQRFTLDLTSYIGSNIYIAFVMTNDDGDSWILDDVNLGSDAPPKPVTIAIPATNAVDVEIEITKDTDDSFIFSTIFIWAPSSEGEPATLYDFYLGDTVDSLGLIGETTSSFAIISGMEYDKKYFWAIVPKNIGGEADLAEIFVWNFTTESNPALSIDSNVLSNVTIYPNPAKDLININSDKIPSKVSIYSLLGKEVANFSQNEIVNNTVNISALSKGVYLMKVFIDKATKTIKIVKN